MYIIKDIDNTFWVYLLDKVINGPFDSYEDAQEYIDFLNDDAIDMLNNQESAEY